MNEAPEFMYGPGDRADEIVGFYFPSIERMEEELELDGFFDEPQVFGEVA